MTKKADKTYDLFLRIGREEFENHGYADASTSRIVKKSGMARGSLYYHFTDKRDLFFHVYKQAMKEISDDLSSAVQGEPAIDLKLLALGKRYFYHCSQSKVGKIAMCDALSVLTHNERHMVSSDTLRPVLTNVVQAIIDMGGLVGQNRDMITMFLFGAITESARIIATLPNKNLAEEKFFETFEWVLAKIL